MNTTQKAEKTGIVPSEQFDNDRSYLKQKGKIVTGARNAERKPFYTESAVVRGAMCGQIWMPNVKCTLALTEDLKARFNRFSNKAGATFRDALLSTLCEKGGDFQSVQFTADTVLIITRRKHISPFRDERRTREIPISELPDCADLVDADTYSFDCE